MYSAIKTHYEYLVYVIYLIYICPVLNVSIPEKHYLHSENDLL